MFIKRVALLVPDGIIRGGIINRIEGDDYSTYEVVIVENFEVFMATVDTFHIVILDISGLRITRVESMMRQLHGCCPKLRLLIVSSRLTILHVQQMISFGAHGFIYREDLDTYLLTGLYVVSRNLAAHSPQVLDLLLTNNQLVILNELREQDIQVLRLIARDQSPKEIADQMGISVRTVYRVRDKLRDVLAVRNNEMLVQAARDQGILDDEDETS